MGDAHALSSRAQVQADPPGEPLGARAEAGVPAAADVELADEREQARGGGVEMRGQLRDLVAEAVQLRDARMGGNDGGAIVRHSESSFCWSDSTPRFSSLPGATRIDEARAHHDRA
jgi:hypothetical protein